MALSTLAKEQENFLRYAILIVDHSKEALQDLLELYLKIKQLTFQEFLDKNQHEIYHLCYDFRCCQCQNSPTRRKRIIFPSQLELLFDKYKKLPSHRGIGHNDYCCSYAKVGITSQVLDLSLARCLLVNCCLDVFWFTCLTSEGQTLEQFLNLNKHIIYHLWKNNQNCCQCPAGYIFPCDSSIITEREWKSMFSSQLSPCEIDRKRMSTGPSSVCSVGATPGIATKDINREIQRCILQNCSHISKAVDFLVEQRNLRFAHVTEAKISDSDFKLFLTDIETHLLGIARVCGKETHVKKILRDLHLKPLSLNMLRKYETLLHKNMEAINKNINLQHRTTRQSIPKLVDKSSKIRKIEERVDALKTSVAAITEEIKNLSQIIKERSKRQRLLDQTSMEIESHESDGTYLEVGAVKHCVQLLESRNVVILSGREGSGKSRNGLEILRLLKEKKTYFDVFKLVGLNFVSDIVKCNMTGIILFDGALDMFDKTCEQVSYIKNILDHLFSYTTQNRVKLIFTMRNTVRHSCQMLLASHRLFRDSVNIDLNSEEFKLTLNEKTVMLNNYCDVNNIQISDTGRKFSRIFLLNGYRNDEYISLQSVSEDGSRVLRKDILEDIIQTDSFLGFPECCRLVTEYKQSTDMTVTCFKWPPYSCVNDIEKLRIEGKDSNTKGLQYATLIYMLFQINLQDNYQQYLLNKSKAKCFLATENIDTQICKDIFKVCYHRSLDVNATDIIDACNDLECRYLMNKYGTYYFQHQSIQDSVLISYYKIEPKAIIPLLSFDHVMDIVQLQSYKEKNEEIVVKIARQHYDEFAKQVILLYEISHADSKFPMNNFESLMKSKIIDRDIDIAYQLIFGIQNRKETLQRFIYNDLLFYILRAILNIEGNRLSVRHIKEEMFVSVFNEPKRITFAINPSRFIRLASRKRYEDTLKWLLLNTDHSLLNLNEILRDFVYVEDKEYLLFILKNLNHKLVDITTFFTIVCLQSDGKLDLVDWIIDNVDNSRIDFNRFFTQLLPDCNHPNWYIHEVILHVLKRADDKIVNFHSILNREILIDYIIESCLLFRTCRVHSYEIYEKIVEILIVIPGIKNSKKVRLLYWASKHKWFGVIEVLIKQDNERVMDIKSIKDAWNDDADPHWQKIIQLLLKYYLHDIDVNEIMERACEVRSNSIIEIIINSYLDDVDVNEIMGNACNAGKYNVIEYLLDHFDHELFNFHTIFDKSLSQRPLGVNSMFGNQEIIFSLLLQKVNNKLFNSDVIINMMNAACHIGHVKSAL